ncbi:MULTISPECIES: sensor histidine kinase [unclassified Corallococcus]|uniref:sensor histidine kinase n=1 Tax=unclassified Corallococcus TaxID=2685029 RepID=UPI001F5C46ED|nr:MULTISPECIES: PAS domain-containing sensor histidine kinase [unclassified Corallococcus]WAS89380.1 PAS domain S-box protein [Corallococcus sp. NCRR]
MECTHAGQDTDVLFRFLVQSAKDRAIFGIDLQGHIISWNTGAEHIKGWRAEEVLGQHFGMLFPEEYRQQGRPQKELKEALDTGHFRGEEPRQRKDGSLFIAEIDLWLLRDDAGHPCGFVKVTQDVTERRLAEVEREALLARERASHAEAEEERHKLYAIFEQAPVGIAIFRGPRHVIQFANPVQCRFWERTREEVVGRPLIELLPETLGPSIIAKACDPVFQKGESRVFMEERFEFTRPDTGERVERYFNYTHVPMRGRDGAVEGFMGVAWDTTDAVKSHQRAAVLTRQLQDRVDFEQQLIGIVSHDLRTPLNAIHLTVSAMARRYELDARTAQSVLRIQSAVHRAGRLVGDLLDFTQARLGEGIPITPRASDLNQVTRQVLAQVDAAHPGRTLRVQERGDATGVWDSERIAQVVQNLVTNALKYSPEASPVQVTTRGEDGWVCLSVHNQGPPIPPEKLPRIFEPLQRATSEVDSTCRSVGLGLYIVKQLVEAHGGTVDVTSTLKQGTTFTVRLPRHGDSGGQ